MSVEQTNNSMSILFLQIRSLADQIYTKSIRTKESPKNFAVTETLKLERFFELVVKLHVRYDGMADLEKDRCIIE